MSLNRKAKNILTYMLITGGGLCLTSCNFFQDDAEAEDGKEPLARVYDRYLYEEDVSGLIPSGLSENDSLVFLQNFINVWAKDQLMIYKAEYNLEDTKKNFEKQIEEYRNDLLKFAYRQDYVRQSLDTNIADTAIRNYYQRSADNLLLKENIVKADYLVVDMNAPELTRAGEWFKDGGSDKDRAQLEDFALRYAYNFSLGDSSWMSMDNLMEILPIEAESQQAFLRENKLKIWDDSTNTYFLRIYDYKLAGEKPPLEYSRDLIRSILINKRKLKLLESLEQNLLEDALKKKEFEVY